MHHNVRAVFHKELGFWDGDPATIYPLLPEDNARRHVELIGRDRILAEGRRAHEDGDYRWAVQILHHLVFADPADDEVRNLQADAYEQLGYQQEVPQYRSIFLCAAQELRNGVAGQGQVNTDTLDTILAMPIDLLFDYAGVHVIGEAAAGSDISIDFTFTDSGGDWTMWVRHGVLNARPAHADHARLTVTGPKPLLAGLILEPGRADEILGHPDISTTGDIAALHELAEVLDTFDPGFDLVTP
ncbi:MAG: hypothetical protein HOQ36_16290 [Nocardia sp.]|nr:hypothetical protein [Nocardia sp.]